ncbi:Gfo/Idh/MocA family protein [Faecalibacterium sp. An121]|uniref:Gfo/Idh/MocA family protein n=1 Tax=Faecalibacterium sp. An121 TaxID=1965550 RepID=UPI000B3759DB|nr:Gfo/Idh/MocA family oxidoreductase [Faecalibacterium sp. An121]OUQ38027.1 hypothetical protein B5E66_07180 [Faecalibacterium sp. An121]
MKGSIRTAVIGMGNMGSQYAALLAAGQVPGMELAAVTRVRPEMLAARGLVLPVGLPVYPTADALFAAVDRGELALDAVIIATPHRLHEQQAVDAMQRQLAVLCDKPAGIASAAARRMEQARPAGLVCGYVFQQRTFPTYRMIRQLVRSGELGKLKRVSWTVTDWYRSNAYYAGSGWRGSWEKDGGGTLLNQCPHNLDMLQWICGMPARTRAFCHNGKYHPIPVEDEATAYLEWPGGATGVFVASTGEAPGVNRLEIALDDGLILCQPDGVRIARLDKPEMEYRTAPGTGFEKPAAHWEDRPMEKEPEAYRVVLADFARAVAAGRPEDLLAPWEEGRKSLLLSNAIYLSSWTGQTVEIPAPGSAEESAFERAFEENWRRQF